MSNESDKLSCIYCGAEINQKALICPHCNKNISCMLTANRVADAALRHTITKTLLELENGRLFDNYSDLNNSLKQSGKVIREGISNYDARLISRELKKFKVDSKIQVTALHKTPETSVVRERPVSKLFSINTLLLIIAIVAGIYYYKIYQNRQDKPSPVIVVTSETTDENKLPASDAHRPDMRDKINNLVSATVFIKGNKSSGSGFIIRKDGYILTNNHVIRNQSSLEVYLESGRRYDAIAVDTRTDLDLALLKIEAQELPILKLGDSTRIRRGEDVWTIGAPKQLAFSVTKGIVSFVGRKVNDTYYIQSDVAINPGNSGGPMISQSGEVIGINTFMITKSQGLNFALPINYVYSGNNPIVASIIDYDIEGGEVEALGSAASGDIKASFSGNEQAESSENNASSIFSDYLERTKRLNSDFGRDQKRLNIEKQRLEQKKARLEAQYERFKADESSLSITDETKITKELQETSIKSLQKDIEIAKQRQNYNRKIKALLRETMVFAKDPMQKKQISNSLDAVNRDVIKVRNDIESYEQQINELRSAVY